MCEYCEKGVPIITGGCWELKIENDFGEGELYVEAERGGYEGFSEHTDTKIKFCPMCGKQLTKKSKYQIEEEKAND